MKPDFRMFSLVFLTVLMWGGWGFFGKLALDRKMSPFNMFLVEVMVSVAFAVPVALRQWTNGDLLGSGGNWNAFGLLSGAGLALGLVFYYLALRRGTASVVVPLTAAYPLVTVLLGWIGLQERLRPLQLVGVLCLVLGAVLLLSRAGAETTSMK